MTPFISIITVSYNSESTIRKTIESIINQTFQNFEYIIIDGQSTDNTNKIVDEYKIILKNRLIHITETDQGIYDAMNKGIDLASGDFAIFMNSNDEFYDETTLAKVVNKINDMNKIYYGRALNVSEAGSWIYPNKKYNTKNIENWLRKELPNHQAMFFPINFYKKEKYDLNFHIAGDADYKYRAKKECDFEFVDEIICKFSIGGISSNFCSFEKTVIKMKESYLLSKKYKSRTHGIVMQIKLISKYILSKFIDINYLTKNLRKVK
jgi:putative colanic acid biosynthesis glycosyltransferase